MEGSLKLPWPNVHEHESNETRSHYQHMRSNDEANLLGRLCVPHATIIPAGTMQDCVLRNVELHPVRLGRFQLQRNKTLGILKIIRYIHVGLKQPLESFRRRR